MRKKYDVSVIQLPFSNIVSVKKPLKTVKKPLRSACAAHMKIKFKM